MPPERRETRPVHDPRLLRAIAHPVRNRVLHELSARGSLRAADVARELGIPANQASFHLRQLAKYGLVEEDPDAARDRRDRVWRLVAQDGWTADLGELEQAPGGHAAVRVFRRNAAAWGHVVVDAAYAPPEDPEHGTFRTVIEEAVRLTKDEAQELAADVDEVLARWVERTRGREEAGEERRTYLLYSVLQPHPGR
jgi:predicted ArsR family transcriptional regulator